jgi:hypothetical protein
MSSKEMLLVGGIMAGVLTVSSCGSAQQPVAAELQVNCDDDPRDVSVVGFQDTDKLIQLGNRVVTFNIADQRENKSVDVKMLGDVAVNGHSLNFNSAGEVLATLPTAKLVAGVPNHGEHINEFYEGDDGVTLICNGATPADAYHQ